MRTEYFKEYSYHLNRDMEMKVYGHTGRPVLFIPCQDGRFFDFENFKMTGTADSSDQLQATFTCKNIEIEGISNGTSTSSSNMTTGNETETSTFSDRQNTEMEVPDSSMEEVTVE